MSQQTVSRSLICRWFPHAVLPEQPKLERAILNPKKLHCCAICGKGFLATTALSIWLHIHHERRPSMTNTSVVQPKACYLTAKDYLQKQLEGKELICYNYVHCKIILNRMEATYAGSTSHQRGTAEVS